MEWTVPYEPAYLQITLGIPNARSTLFVVRSPPSLNFPQSPRDLIGGSGKLGVPVLRCSGADRGCFSITATLAAGRTIASPCLDYTTAGDTRTHRFKIKADGTIE